MKTPLLFRSGQVKAGEGIIPDVTKREFGMLAVDDVDRKRKNPYSEEEEEKEIQDNPFKNDLEANEEALKKGELAAEEVLKTTRDLKRENPLSQVTKEAKEERDLAEKEAIYYIEILVSVLAALLVFNNLQPPHQLERPQPQPPQPPQPRLPLNTDNGINKEESLQYAYAIMRDALSISVGHELNLFLERESQEKKQLLNIDSEWLKEIFFKSIFDKRSNSIRVRMRSGDEAQEVLEAHQKKFEDKGDKDGQLFSFLKEMVKFTADFVYNEKVMNSTIIAVGGAQRGDASQSFKRKLKERVIESAKDFMIGTLKDVKVGITGEEILRELIREEVKEVVDSVFAEQMSSEEGYKKEEEDKEGSSTKRHRSSQIEAREVARLKKRNPSLFFYET